MPYIRDKKIPKPKRKDNFSIYEEVAYEIADLGVWFWGMESNPEGWNEPEYLPN